MCHPTPLCHPTPSLLINCWKATHGFHPYFSHMPHLFHATPHPVTTCLSSVSPLHDPTLSVLTLFQITTISPNGQSGLSCQVCVNQELSSFHGGLNMWIFNFENGLKNLLPYVLCLSRYIVIASISAPVLVLCTELVFSVHAGKYGCKYSIIIRQSCHNSVVALNSNCAFICQILVLDLRLKG